MIRSASTPLLAGILFLLGCSSTPNAGQATPPPTPATQEPASASVLEPPAEPDLDHIDDGLAARAQIVLRVELLRYHGGSKYSWDEVRPIAVLKNDTRFRFQVPLRVAHYGWKPGIPRGVSTIYLEAYGGHTTNVWRLLDADGTHAVSHPATP